MRYKLDPFSPNGISVESETKQTVKQVQSHGYVGSAPVYNPASDTIHVLKAGDTMSGDLNVPDEVYGSGWNGSTEVPTKNAVYDKIETLGSSSGDVVGPSSATDNAIARFDTTTGKLLQNSSVTINDSGDTVGKSFVSTRDGTITRTSGLVSSVALAGGRTLTITRDVSNRISTVADGTRTWTFTRTSGLISSWTVT